MRAIDTKKLMRKLEELKRVRTEACEVGDISIQQETNYQLIEIAKKLKINYYDIA